MFFGVVFRLRIETGFASAFLGAWQSPLETLAVLLLAVGLFTFAEDDLGLVGGVVEAGRLCVVVV